MKTNICRRPELEKKAAKLIIRKVNQTLSKKSKVILGIPGGTSVKPIFKEICKAKLNRKKIHIFLVDERLVPLTDKDSNYNIAKDYFLGTNLHFFDYQGSEKSYYSFLKKHGGKFDILLLSVGEDGHVASLFPNHSSIKNNSTSYIRVTNSPKPPRNRISASRKLLQKSKTAVLIFFRESKEKAYKDFTNPKLSVRQCPAKLVNKIKDTHVFHAFC